MVGHRHAGREAAGTVNLPLPAAAVAAYSAVAVLFVLAPGMATAVVLRNTAEGGRRAGVLTALGIALGNVTWATAIGAGLGVMLMRTPGALGAVRLVGAGCLTWLGVRSLARARTMRRAGGGSPEAAPHQRVPAPAAMLAEGAVTNLLNPSIPVFYAAAVQPFIRPADPFVASYTLLAGIHVAMALVCHGAYATVFGWLARALTVRGRAWTLHAVTGAALIGLAALGAWATVR